jgi:hypothetical protein
VCLISVCADLRVPHHSHGGDESVSGTNLAEFLVRALPSPIDLQRFVVSRRQMLQHGKLVPRLTRQGHDIVGA